MPTVDDIAAKLELLAPLSRAEEWDNVGLLVGDRRHEVRRIMTCLTLTPVTAEEAIDGRADLVVVHHPLPFRSLTRVTTDTIPGRLLWELIGAGICVYSAHTAFDSAQDGINEQWAAELKLGAVESLVPSVSDGADRWLGAGRCGALAAPIVLAELVERIKGFLSLDRVHVVGDEGQQLARIAVACGSGGSFLEAARAKRCDCLVTGEASFHTCLEAEAGGLALVLCGHFASERFAMVRLADVLAELFADVSVWASRNECDPLRLC